MNDKIKVRRGEFAARLIARLTINLAPIGEHQHNDDFGLIELLDIQTKNTKFFKAKLYSSCYKENSTAKNHFKHFIAILVDRFSVLQLCAGDKKYLKNCSDKKSRLTNKKLKQLKSIIKLNQIKY